MWSECDRFVVVYLSTNIFRRLIDRNRFATFDGGGENMVDSETVFRWSLPFQGCQHSPESVKDKIRRTAMRAAVS